MAKKSTNQQKNRPEAVHRNTGLGFYLILGAVAVVGAGALWYAAFGGGGAPANPPLSVADMEAEASGAAGVSMGPADAPVTIIEFEDYRCPSCRNFNAQTGRLLRQNYATGDDAVLRWVSYDFPVFGQVSWPPAIAARCANDQGRFWEMHDLLYARTESWYGESNPNAAFVDLAGVVGLDVGEFRQCLERRPHLQAIAASRKYGESIGVSSTPSLYLNGRPVPHTPRNTSYAGMEELVLQAVERARAAEQVRAAEEDGTTGG